MPRSAEENAGWTTLIRVDVRARAGTARDGLPKKKKKKDWKISADLSFMSP